MGKVLWNLKHLNLASKRIEVSLYSRSPLDKHLILLDVSSTIADQLGIDIEKVKPNKKIRELGADPMDIIKVMMALEDKFDIELNEKEAANITTVTEASELICK